MAGTRSRCAIAAIDFAFMRETARMLAKANTVACRRERPHRGDVIGDAGRSAR
jgi:hypothetical protein